MVTSAADADPAALHRHGVAAFRAGDGEGAVALLERAAAGAPSNAAYRRDLCEMLRLQGRIADPSEAKLATLERNGQISAIPRQP